MKSKMKFQVSITYLSYVPYGTGCFINFIKSYLAFKPSIEHNLYIVFKGFFNENELVAFSLLIDKYKVRCSVLLYKNEGFDIDAYKWIAGQLEEEFILFFNTKSQILSENWLKYFLKAASENPKSVIGATGSYQSYLSSVFQKNKCFWETNKNFKQNFDKYKLFIKAGTLWRLYFKPFPNPHIRTNAFFINRAVFLSLQFPIIKNKLDAYRFESGRQGFTSQLIKNGFTVLLLDKFGTIYPVTEWASSKIFWQASQENLLIADNQTEMYDQSDLSEKEILSFLAWGKR